MLLRRYGNIDYIMQMDVPLFLAFVKNAIEEDRDEKIRQQWLALLPVMQMGYCKYVSLNDYKMKVTGANIDTRPTEVIVNEILELHKNVRKEE